MKLTYRQIHKLLDKGIEMFVDSPTGKKKILNKFSKMSEGYIIKYDDGTETNCAVAHNMIFNDVLKGASEIQVGDIDYLSHKKVISKTKIPEQEYLDFEISDPNGLYIQNGIIHHNSGKSLSISLILEFFRRSKKRGILIVPNINLLTQFKSDIDSYGLKELSEETLLLGNGHESDFSTCLTITTWQSLMKHMDNLNFDFIICDECLHPDTLITTKSGSKYIKDVKTGDLVLSYNEATNEYEYKDVVEVHKNLASSRNEKIYDIELENGKIITITGNHTVFTKRGWIRADNLTLEDDILETPNEL